MERDLHKILYDDDSDDVKPPKKKKAKRPDFSEAPISSRQFWGFAQKLNRCLDSDSVVPSAQKGRKRRTLVCDADFYDYVASKIHTLEPDYWRTKIFVRNPLFTKYGNWNTDLEKIVMPVNRPSGTHWISLTMIPRDHVIVVRDSMAVEYSLEHKELALPLIEMMHIYNNTTTAVVWTIHLDVFTTLQTDAYNCAVYVGACMLAEACLEPPTASREKQQVSFASKIRVRDIDQLRRVLLTDKIVPFERYSLDETQLNLAVPEVEMTREYIDQALSFIEPARFLTAADLDQIYQEENQLTKATFVALTLTPPSRKRLKRK